MASVDNLECVIVLAQHTINPDHVECEYSDKLCSIEYEYSAGWR